MSGYLLATVPPTIHSIATLMAHANPAGDRPSTDPSSNSLAERLELWRDRAQIYSWAELARRAKISRYRLRQLRCGQIERWPLIECMRVCEVLQISSATLFAAAGLAIPPTQSEPPTNEFATTEADVASQPAETTREIWERSALDRLEPFLRQWPTAVYAARHHNLPIEQLIRVLSTWERLLELWDIHSIGKVGETVPFDPSWQQPLTDDRYQSGTPVSIRYVGYRWKDKLWLRAQVRASLPSSK